MEHDIISDTAMIPPTMAGIGGLSGKQRRDLRAYSLSHPAVGHIPTNKLNLEECTKLIIFNINSASPKDIWDEMRHILSVEMSSNIVKIQRVNKTHRRPHAIMWVRKDLAANLARNVRDMSRRRTFGAIEAFKAIFYNGGDKGVMPFSTRAVSSWRLAIWQSWRDRSTTKGAPNAPSSPRPNTSRIATWNVNGFHKKRNQVIDFINEEEIAILALQETLVSRDNYDILIPGYLSYSRPREEGFRGQAVLVDNRLASYEVPHAEKHILHVKVAGVYKLGKPIHVFSIYLPSGGLFRKERRALIVRLINTCDSIFEQDHSSMIVCLGDFNCSDSWIDNRFRKRNYNTLRRAVPVGSPESRFPLRGKSSSLDHMLTSPGMDLVLGRPRVERSYNASDHRPLVAQLKEVSPDVFVRPNKTFRVDNKVTNWKSEDIVFHNSWNIFTDLLIDTADKLSEAAVSLSETVKTACTSQGAYKDLGQETKEVTPRHLQRKLKKYKECSKALSVALDHGGTVPSGVEEKYRKARRAYRKSRRAHERRQKNKLYARISDDFVMHDHKNVWSRLRAQVGIGIHGSNLPPVKGSDGVLRTETNEILEAITDHYKSLAQDDPEGLSKNEEHWAKIDLGEEKPTIKQLNTKLKWREALLAIRGMNRNTSPGKDVMHVNVLKAMVKEECIAQLSQENPGFKRPDNVRVDLPEHELPEDPLSPMGKALFKVLEAVWELEVVPDLWNEVYIVNLLKGGKLDPELLSNYRGISLISCSFKVLLAIMANRLYEGVEKANLIHPEQSGFRRNEEAVAQFIAVAEIVRRRHIIGKPTYGVFIDFKKAFDKVHHEALYRVLRHLGIRGKFLNIIKFMYDHSIMTVRAGGHLANSFNMLRGNRQGCPLSPLLFILFMNTILEESLTKGVSVPITDGSLECKAGMYADDVLLLSETAEDAVTSTTHVETWGKIWGMELNLAKCGIIAFSDDEALLEVHNNTIYRIPGGEIPKVEEYKYLGITVDRTLGFSRVFGQGVGSMERRYVRGQAEKGLKALGALKPLLSDRNCPLPLKAALLRNLVLPLMVYGSEFVAYKQDHAHPLQRVMRIGAQWAIGMRDPYYSEEKDDGFSLMYELNLPWVEAEMARLRARLWSKLEHEGNMRTWLQILHKHPYKHQKDTWVSLNPKWYNRLITDLGKWSHWSTDEAGYRWTVDGYIAENDPNWKPVGPLDLPGGRRRLTYEDQPTREWAARGTMYELHSRSNSYTSEWIEAARQELVGVDQDGFYVTTDNGDVLLNRTGRLWLLDPDFNDERQAQLLGSKKGGMIKISQRKTMRDVHDILVEHEMTKREDSVISFIWYDQWCFGATRDFLRSAISRPDLAEGVRWLVAIRTGRFPAVGDTYDRAEALGHNPNFERDKCPLCMNNVEAGFEWAHLLVKCEHKVCRESRIRDLHDPIVNISQQISRDHRKIFEPMDVSGVSDENVTLGGVVAIFLVGGVVQERWDYQYHLGFGQCDQVTPGLETYGYTYTASFLQTVCPLYMTSIGLDTYGENLSKDEDKL